MFSKEIRRTTTCLAASMGLMSVAHAQWAVIDVGAIVQLVQEVQEMEQQIAVAKGQLQQAKQTLQSMTGNRGMQYLLSGTNRNYLPSNWPQLSSLQSPGGGYPGLSSNVQSTITANAVLSSQSLAALPSPEQQQIQSDRLWVAVQQVISRDALANVSSRFAAIQSLIDSIPAATDQKGILELQARISAELGMLQNEQTKLQVLAQATRAQQAANAQQAQEQAIAGHGQFATRFQPTLDLPRQ
jgi:type IV secretion system protein VirB5